MTALRGRLRVHPVLAVGVVLAAAYAAVLMATLRLDGAPGGDQPNRVRPLYDGFAPPTPYRWVDPPPEFEDGNVKPRPSTTEIPIGPDGFKASGASTEDGQLVLNLPDGAIEPRPGDNEVRVVITPLAPGKLGPRPPGLFADGNAYKVELSYRPSGQVIDTLAKPGQVLLTVPVPAVAVVFSPDGRTWERLETTTSPTAGTAATTGPVTAFSRAGHYLGAADHPTAVPDQNGSGGTGTVLVVAGLAVALVVGLVVVPGLVRRSRQRRRRGRASKRPRSSTPAAKKSGRPKPSGGGSPRPGGAKKTKKKKKKKR